MKKNGNSILLAAVVAAVLVGVMSPSYGDVLGHWELNDPTVLVPNPTTAADSSGNGNTGTLQGNTTWTADGGGHTGLAGDYALSFDGTGDYVTAPHSTSLAPTTATVTIEAYIKPDADAAVARHGIASKYWLYSLQYEKYSTANDRFRFVVRTGSGIYEYAPYATGHLPSDSWTHVKAVYDASLGTDTMRVYLDGTRIEPTRTIDATGSFGTGSQPLHLGAWANSGGTRAHYFDGSIDDVKITPEPATMVLLGLGGIGLLVRRRRRAE